MLPANHFDATARIWVHMPQMRHLADGVSQRLPHDLGGSLDLVSCPVGERHSQIADHGSDAGAASGSNGPRVDAPTEEAHFSGRALIGYQ